MNLYRARAKESQLTQYEEIYRQAFLVYKTIKARTKRRPYIRSAYFKKDKIFLDFFWQHLTQKNWRDRRRRLRYFQCAIELLQNSKIPPESFQNPSRKHEMLHRFYGMSANSIQFCVQVKEDKRNNQKHLMSVFPL